MQTVQNIQDIKYFTNQWDIIDNSYEYSLQYPTYGLKNTFYTLPTFVAEFYDCKVHSCPLLVTYQQKLITNYIWGLTDQRRNKPEKTHKLWKEWGAEVQADLPPVTQHFHEKYQLSSKVLEVFDLHLILQLYQTQKENLPRQQLKTTLLTYALTKYIKR